VNIPENSAVSATAVFTVPGASQAPYVGGDVQRRLREQPEREDTEDDAEQDTIIPDETCPSAYPGRFR